jgi:type IV pilus assembly protein PilW
MTFIYSEDVMVVSPVRKKMGNHGFTLVELMIAMAVGGIVMAAVMTSFLSQHRSYLAQDEVVTMQQNVRVAMDMLTRDIRSAGYDPTEAGLGIIPASDSQTLTFERYDDVSNVVETIRYTIYSAYGGTVSAIGRARAIGGGALINQPLAENIEQLEFRYLDEDGNVTANLADIRAIQISLLAVASRPDQNFTNTMTYTTASGAIWDPVDDNLRRRLLITTVQCRNLGL